MLKRSDDQEWTRFRSGAAREREEPSDTGEQQVPVAPAAPQAPAAAVAPAPNQSFRAPVDPSQAPSSRLSRGVGVDTHEVESLVGERTTFEGNLHCEGSLRILGTVQGEVESKGSILIDERAHVTARVTGAQITVAGCVDGQVYSSGKVEIRSTGRVLGEIHAATLVIQEGAVFDGSSKMEATPPTA